MRKLSDRQVLALELMFCTLPLAYYLLRLPLMPEQVPVHWNASGEADRFAGRFSFDMLFTAALGYLGLLFGIGLKRMICSISKTETSQNEEAVERIAKWTQAAMCLLFTGMSAYFIGCTALAEEPGSDFLWKLGTAVVGLVLAGVGNMLPKLRRNSLSGARTRYSLSSDEAWYKTQRYAGRVMLLSGAALFLVSLLPMVTGEAAALAALAAFAVMTVLTVSYKGGK